MLEEKERLENQKREGWFKPEISKKSERLATKIKKVTGQKPIHKRSKEIIQEREEYLKALRQQQEEKENSSFVANCSFQPNSNNSFVDAKGDKKHRHDRSISKSRSRSPVLGIGHFLENQMEYEKKRESHMNDLKKKAETDFNKINTYRPRINSKSKELASKSRSFIGIDKKLYQDAKQKEKKMNSLREEYMKEICPFKPSIHPSEASQFGATITKSKAKEALEKLTLLLESDQLASQREAYQGASDSKNSKSFQDLKPILKSSSKSKNEVEPEDRTPSNKKTAKKVYFNDWHNRANSRSYHDKEGYFNIVFDKRSIRELKEHLKLA